MNIEKLPLLHRFWGKARPREGENAAYHPLVYHCLDVAAVGSQRRLIMQVGYG